MNKENLKCMFCETEKKNKNSLTQHQIRCKKNPDKIIVYSYFLTDEYKKKVSEEGGDNQYTKAKKLGLDKPKVSAKTRERLSAAKKAWHESVDKNELASMHDKISKSMKIAHKEGRAWNIGMSRWNNEASYPENFFMKVIENEFIDKNYKREFPIGIYSSDFCWEHLKKVIEIDGEQHQRFAEIKERDERKDVFLESMGYKVLRIPWIEMMNNSKAKIKEAYEFIHNN